MSVQNGQPVNAAINNAANMSRLVDTSTIGKVDVVNTTDSTLSTNGAIHTLGGLGVEKSVNVGANLNVGNNASVTGSLSVTGNSTVTGNQTVTGNLTVLGSSTTLSTAVLDVTDINITVNKSGNDATSAGAGLTVDRTGTKGSLVYENALASRFKIGDLGSERQVADVSSTQTLTNKTLNGNTATNLVSGAATITLPTTTGTLATLSNTETLTNKTLTGNIATNLVSGAATVTLPTTTSTLATLALTETLTNKTLTSPVINTPTGIVKADVGLSNVDNTSDLNKPVSTAQAAADALRRTYARVSVGDASGSVAAATRVVALTATLTASRTFTLPLASAVPAGEEIIFADDVGGISSVNTLIIAASGADTIGGVASITISASRAMRRLISNGSNAWTWDQGVLRSSNNLSDLASAATARTNLSLGNVDNTSDATKNAAVATLTNKTLTTPVISSIVNTGTLSLPTSTDTLVGKATTDTFTNKSISGATNTITGVSLTTSVTGTLPIANGGTNAITANAGLNNLLPTQIGNLGKALVTDGSNTSWATVASSGGGGAINFVTGGDAESGTTGFVVDSFAAATRPAGALTGVSTGVTFTASSTTPLAGTNSFLFAKDAVNRQGRVVYTGITITPAYFAKVLQVSADYLVSSGTFVAGTSTTDSDVIFYLQDVTNSTFIEPSSFKLLSNSTTISDKFNATFQTSATGTSYRLLMYVASTSAVAYTLKLDNISISPSTYVYGTPITDASPAETGSGSLVTNATYTRIWRRDGDKIQEYVRIAFAGATTGATTLQINTKFSINFTKYPAGTATNTEAIGVGSFLDLSAVRQYKGVVAFGTGNTVRIVSDNSTAPWSDSIPVLIAAGDVIEVSFEYYAQGLSSSVQTSDTTDTRIVDFKIERSALATSLFTAGAVKQTYDIAPTIDTHGAWDSVNNRYVIRVPGDYQIHAAVYVSAVAAAHLSNLRIRQNGNDRTQDVTPKETTSSINFPYRSTTVISCIAGDYIELFFDNQSGSTLSSLGTATVQVNKLAITRVSGPSAIAATESISARYISTTSTNVVTGTILDFPTKDWDTHGAVTTGASWKFTAPISGEYEFKVFLNTGAASAAAISNAVAVRSSKNGGAADIFLALTRAITTAAVPKTATGSTRLRLLAGETFSYLGYNDTGQLHPTSTGTGENYVEVRRVGNY